MYRENVALGPPATNSVTRTCMALRLSPRRPPLLPPANTIFFLIFFIRAPAPGAAIPPRGLFRDRSLQHTFEFSSENSLHASVSLGPRGSISRNARKCGCRFCFRGDVQGDSELMVQINRLTFFGGTVTLYGSFVDSGVVYLLD